MTKCIELGMSKNSFRVRLEGPQQGVSGIEDPIEF